MKQRKDQVGIDGENLIEEIASKVFFGEFVFNELWFIHKDIKQGTNVELADLIISIGNDFLAFQVKTREENKTSDREKSWVKNQIKKAKTQLVDTFNYLKVDRLPEFVNKKGDAINFGIGGLFSGIIVLNNEKVCEYPKVISCNRVQGVFHCFTKKDFDICCDKLVLPKEILEYLFYRERYYEVDKEEAEGEEVCLDKFLIHKYGVCSFNNSSIETFKWILNNYRERLIEENRGSIQYREIVQVLALFERFEVDTFMNIFSKLYVAAQQGIYADYMFMQPEKPYKHSVLFISLNELNTGHVSRLTQLFMYKTKIEKCLTVILYIEDENNFEVDWLLTECSWEQDDKMDKIIEELGIQSKWVPKKILARK